MVIGEVRHFVFLQKFTLFSPAPEVFFYAVLFTSATTDHLSVQFPTFNVFL